MLKKICKCGKVIDQRISMCDECMIKHKEAKKESNRVYNSHNRDKDLDTFYHSDEWEDIRECILSKYKYLDLYDYFINKKITLANTVHHIVEIKDDYNLRLSEENLIPLSAKTHSKIHKLYRKDKEKTQTMLREILECAKKFGF